MNRWKSMRALVTPLLPTVSCLPIELGARMPSLKRDRFHCEIGRVNGGDTKERELLEIELKMV